MTVPGGANRATSDGTTALDVSVVIPLVSIRGPLAECLSSWTHRQRLDRDRYEVIVATPGDDRRSEAIARQALGSSDRLIVEPTHNPYRLYDAGIRASRGRIAVITESHVHADDEVLAGIVALFDVSGCAAACCRSVSPPNGGFLADLEGRLFEEEEAAWGADGHWRRVHERGFAIRRETYFAHGGFECAYEGFAGREFSVRLHEAGEDVRYARHLEVTHHNANDLRQVEEATASFARGEMLYLRRGDRDRTERYFDARRTAAELTGASRALMRTWLRDQLNRIRRRGFPTRDEARNVLDLGARVTFGRRWRLVRARLGLERSRARLHAARWRRDSNALETYRDFWHRHLARYHQLRHFTSGPSEIAPRDVHSAADSDGFVRFHSAESVNGQSIRWSESLAALHLQPPSGFSRLRLETARIGPPPLERGLALYLDGRRLADPVAFEDGFRLDYRAQPQGIGEPHSHTLAIAIEPLRHDLHIDPRDLGVPFVSLAIE